VSEIWDSLIEVKDNIIEIFDDYGTEINEPGMQRFNQPENGWINRVWESQHCRRCHVDVVDARDTKSLWMMHVCVFPKLDNNGPIYGFDVIAGKNKITGAFHDYSPLGGPNYEHPMVDWFADTVADFVPKKQRTLPEWAENIFSGSMIAAGNVQEPYEIDEICRFATNNLKVYMEVIGDYAGQGNDMPVAKWQDYYCENQQQNPHTPKVMKSLGLNEQDVEIFCTDALFPKINK